MLRDAVAAIHTSMDLATFKDTEAPRAAELCRKYSRRVDPWWGFVAYGILWFFGTFVAFGIGVIGGVSLGRAAGGAKGSLPVTALGIALGVTAFVIAWIPFVRWAKRRRAKSLPLIRDGVIVEGRVFDPKAQSHVDRAKRLVGDYVVGQIGVKFYRVTIEHAGMARMVHIPAQSFGPPPAPGGSLPVLFHPACAHVLVFDQRGKACVAHVRA